MWSVCLIRFKVEFTLKRRSYRKSSIRMFIWRLLGQPVLYFSLSHATKKVCHHIRHGSFFRRLHPVCLCIVLTSEVWRPVCTISLFSPFIFFIHSFAFACVVYIFLFAFRLLHSVFLSPPSLRRSPCFLLFSLCSFPAWWPCDLPSSSFHLFHPAVILSASQLSFLHLCLSRGAGRAAQRRGRGGQENSGDGEADSGRAQQAGGGHRGVLWV